MIEPAARFFCAEDYHQKYRLRHDRELFAAFAGYSPEAFRESTVAARLNALVANGQVTSDFESELPRYGLTPAQERRVLALARRSQAPLRLTPA